MKKLIIFNWKMAPDSLKEAKRFFNAVLDFKSYIINSEIVITPPFVYLNEFKNKKLKNLKLGAQDVFWENAGAYTGEISAKMLKNSGVEYVIVGHSERRKYLNETDEIINKKVLAGLKAGLKVILCVGEDLLIRRHGKKAAENFIKKQLEKDLKGIRSLVVSRKLLVRNFTIAYEPIWAIGAGHSDTPQDAVEIIKYIKNLLAARYSLNSIRVLYGGSVDSKNAANFLKHPEIDGALVGHSSLKAEEVKKMILLTNSYFTI